MNTASRLTAALLVASALLAGCATSPSARFQEKSSVASTWSPEVQQKVKDGVVEPGFTKDQVYVALGSPDRVYTRTTAEGTFEIWAYHGTKPRFSIGLGGGSGHMFGGAVVSTGGHSDETARVVLKDGVVSSVERSTGS